jgi:NADH:ubiquinone oxidoreductase subunit
LGLFSRHRWLQYISDDPPTTHPLPRQTWMIDHIENRTGTSQIYVPYTTVRPKIQSWQPPTTQNTSATKNQLP